MHVIGLPKGAQPLPPSPDSPESLDPVEPIDPKIFPFDLYDQFVDRVDLPPCPEVFEGALVASQELICHADRNTSPTRYRRWGNSLNVSDRHGIWAGPKWHLDVREYHGRWFIRRQHADIGNWFAQDLSFVFGPSLFCAPNWEAAKRLAVFFHFTPIEAAGGVGWTTQLNE